MRDEPEAAQNRRRRTRTAYPSTAIRSGDLLVETVVRLGDTVIPGAAVNV